MAGQIPRAVPRDSGLLVEDRRQWLGRLSVRQSHQALASLPESSGVPSDIDSLPARRAMWKKLTHVATARANDRLSQTLPAPFLPRGRGPGRIDKLDSQVVPASGGRCPRSRTCARQGSSRHQPDPLQRSHWPSPMYDRSILCPVAFYLQRDHLKMQPRVAPVGHTDCSERITKKENVMNP